MDTTIKIQNLKCGGCANTIVSKLSSIVNISKISVNTEESTVSFNFQEENDLFLVKKALKKIGYPEEGTINSLGSKATSYVSCAIGKIKK